MTMTDTQIDYENPWLYKGTAFTTDDIGDFSVLSTGLQIYRMVDSTSEENISTKSVNPLAVREEFKGI